MNIVAIGAHPDDLEIFVYGFLATALARDNKIYLGVATNGAAGGDTPGPELATQRCAETCNGLAPLGKPTLLNLPDGKLTGNLEAGDRIADFIRNNSPDLVITHAPEDYHPDHRALSSFVTDAVGFVCPVLFCDTLMGIGFTPDYYVDITAHFPAKQNAIMAHTTQNPSRFASASAIMNRYRAAQCNAPDGHYAEAYRADNRFPFADIRDLLPPPPPYRPFYVPGSDALI